MKLQQIATSAVRAVVQSTTAGLLTFPSIKTENFEEKDEGANVFEIFLMVIAILFSGLYFMVMFGLWIRLIVYAFQSDVLEGFSSIFVYQLYNMYKMGSFIHAFNKM